MVRCWLLLSDELQAIGPVVLPWTPPPPRRLRTLPGHKQRVGCMAWNHHTLATGSRDRGILLRDVRVQEPYVQKLAGHRSEVGG